MSELLPTLQADDVRQGLVDYLTTTFALADPEAQATLVRFLQDPRDGIFKGPYVRLRLPFRAAAPGWERALDWRPPLQPYGHQARAFERLCSANLGPDKPRPLPTLVTTGTGSGKTEAFLVPIIDHVLRAKAAGVGGIKALILYPMNALANDQARRLATLITEDSALGGIRAALYTGQTGTPRSTVTKHWLITDRTTLHAEAPDILLTNYKMLDQLLLRPADQTLWRQSALSLRYLVLDEFHTYDGAQGTDVAMLLRRLGLALAREWPAEHPDLTAEVRARPLGLITPVATSATLGDGGDPTSMIGFATTVFGDDFGADSVVAETRQTLEVWATGATERMTARGLSVQRAAVDDSTVSVLLAALAVLEESRRDAQSLTAMVLNEFYDDRAEVLSTAATRAQPTDSDAALLLDALQAHPFLRSVIAACESAVSLDDLAHTVFPTGLSASQTPQARDEDRRTLLIAVLGAISHIRMIAGRTAPSLDLHLWVRSLTRIDRVAQPTPAFRWTDDGEIWAGDEADAVADTASATFPAIYCRHCGRSGWGVELAPVGFTLASDDEAIRRNHANSAMKSRFRALIYAPREGQQSLDQAARHEPRAERIWWLRVSERELTVEAPTDEERERSIVLPVLTLEGDTADDDSRADLCPNCDKQDGIRFLGSAIATQLSVAVTTMFGDRHLDVGEKKALVFTDSVQDAAHRAGFVQSRAHVFNFRNAVRSAIHDTMSLDEVADAMFSDADTADRRYRLLPPDLVDRVDFRTFWDRKRGEQPTVAIRNRVKERMRFDLALEFGLLSRVGRTLELTGSVAASVDAGPASRLEAIGRAAIEGFETAWRIDDPAHGAIGGAQLVNWVRGVVERMRERGAIEHAWLQKYVDHNGERWYVWGGRPRNQGMPAFPKGREAPAFPRVGTGPASKQQSLLDHATSAQSWYARWACRFLPVSVADGAKLARALFEQLDRAGIVVAHRIGESNAIAYGIAPSRILVSGVRDDDLAAGRHLLVCHLCETPVPGSIETVKQLVGGPCLAARCAGRLHAEPGAVDGNYYRRQYDDGEMRRVVAREHTSLLDDATRLRYETEFKSSAQQPDAPNVLVATPTLEMGIDIGDLSAVFLAGLPRTVSSYLQRVGRAGRLTGNALAMAFVLGRGDQLPKLGDPLSVINGTVRPPATYLNAIEILQRQYTASVIDRLVAGGGIGAIGQARSVLRSTEGTAFLALVIEDAETHVEQRLGAFLGSFAQLSDPAREALRDWATPAGGPRTSGLAARIIQAATKWNSDVDTLRLRRAAIEASIPELEQRATAPAQTSDDQTALRAARASVAMVRREIEALRSEHWVAALERFGVLPNYTLLDDRVQLDVALSWIDPDSQEYRNEPRSYERGRSIAIRELAPGATFYAQGLEIEIDAVDLGREGERIQRMTFCPSCGYVQELAPGAAAVLICPRCGEQAIADTNQTMPVVEMEQVSAEVRRDESSISDRSDERTRIRFALQVAVDFDPAKVVASQFVEQTGFGYRYFDDLVLRWVNLGKAGVGSVRRVAGGGDQTVPLFRVCVGCGKLDQQGNVNTSREHRSWCRYRMASEEHTETLALTRTLRTQGLLLRLPTSMTIGDSLALPSLAAAVQLGLAEKIGGDPDHLRLAVVAEPVLGDGSNNTALLIHDAVPGGTGYLADLADIDRIRDVLELAWARLRDCACASEGRAACDKCLLPYAIDGSTDSVSRVSALRNIETLLRVSDGQARPWAVTTVDPGVQDPETVLEQWFRQEFRDRVEVLGATVKEIPGEWGSKLSVTIPGRRRVWTLRPQVQTGSSRPDFVLEASGAPVTPIAIFTDGFAYHASVTHNRIADDAQKRRTLRELGYHVLAITWDDVRRARDAEAEPAATWFDPTTAPMVAKAFDLSPSALEFITANPLDLLMQWIQDPGQTEERWRRVAIALPFLAVSRSTPDSADGPLIDRVGPLATAETAPSSSGSGWALVRPHLAMACRRAASGGTATDVALALDDSLDAVGQPGFREAWQLWLRLSNLLGARDAHIARLVAVSETRGDTGPLVGPIDFGPSGFTVEWQGAYDSAVGAERDLIKALSVVPHMVVPEIGLEVADGIPLTLAWSTARVTIDLELGDDDREDLEKAGWTVVEPEVDAIVAALGGV